MKLKICCISDTHSLHDSVKIPECDYLFHAGDMLNRGNQIELAYISNWFEELKEARVVKEDVICIGGNHDRCLEQGNQAKSFLSNVKYLENQSYVLINGMTIFASPYTPRFLNWYFMHDRDKMYEEVWQHVPKDTNIILTHGPSYGVLDEVAPQYRKEGEDFHVGCKGLKRRMGELQNLKYVIHGHIHNNYGRLTKNGIKYINCSTCNESYEPVNKPILIEI